MAATPICSLDTVSDQDTHGSGPLDLNLLRTFLAVHRPGSPTDPHLILVRDHLLAAGETWRAGPAAPWPASTAQEA